MSLRPDAALLLSHLESLKLQRLGDQPEAGIVQVSLPWPPARPTLKSLGGRAAYVQPLGQWFGVTKEAPRRLFVCAEGGTETPAELSLAGSQRAARVKGKPATATAVLFERSQEPQFVWESHYLRLDYGGRSFGLALGLRTGGKVNWWQACRLVEEVSTPFCRIVHMAGAIPVDHVTFATMLKTPGYKNPYLHNHNWLNGDLYCRLYANGVCEVIAHHVNAAFFDSGKDFHDVVPVVGFRPLDSATAEPIAALPQNYAGQPLGPVWDGETSQFTLDGIPFDVTEPARFATPDEPGRFDREGDFTAWQPYAGVSLFGGVQPKDVKNDPWHYRSYERVWPRGMARTLTFSLSLGKASPRIVRYQAPYWWYGANAELTPTPCLPVRNAFDARLDAATVWVRNAAVQRGFETGDVPRGADLSKPPPGGRFEPGWDGDPCYGQFLMAYRSGQQIDYQWALRSAYCMADVCTDHAAKQVRMHGYPGGAYAIPMNRVVGMLMAYFETADPYLLNIGEAVVDNSWRTHLNSWPRLAIGRDACFLRGAVFLYRYNNDDHYRRIAAAGCRHVTQVQRANGTFGDQGGGTGIHQWAAYITKPWMACLGTSAVLDYLMLDPETPHLTACIHKLGDWLLANRWERNGIYSWSYQHDFDGGKVWFDLTHNRPNPLPSEGQWHDDHLARILGYCTWTKGDPTYLDAYLRSLETVKDVGGGHGFAACSVFLLWLQSYLWQAQLTPNGVVTTPLYGGPRCPATAEVITPTGPQPVTCPAPQA